MKKENKHILFLNKFLQMVLYVSLFYSATSLAQVASINITNIHKIVMSNTKNLFGITFDARTSLTGNSSYGQIGYHNANGTIIPEVDAIFKDLPYTTIRYPGNAIAVGFEWKKSIGAIGTRPNQDLLGAVGAAQPVNFGFDEFMAMCEAKGIKGQDIQIMVPIYDESTPGLTSTQKLAAIPNVIANNADWVEYCNSPNNGSNPGGGIDWALLRAANGHSLPFNIKIWNIGNEPWATGEFGPSAVNCNDYLTSVTPIINSMLAIDPTIKITLPTIGNGAANTWAYTLINSALAQQGKIYSLSQHFFGDEDLSTNNPGVNSSSAFIDNLVTAAAVKNIKVFVGDYAHSIPTPNPTMAQQDLAMQWQGANFEVDFLLMLSQKSTIERSNFWAYGNAYAVWHPIRKNFFANYTPMPAAAIYKKLEPAFLDNSIQVTTTSPAASDGNPYAVRSNAFISNDMNKLNVVAVNRDRKNEVAFQVNGVSGYSLYKSRLLNASALNSEIIIESSPTINNSGNFIMPSMSVLIWEYVKATVGVKETVVNNQIVLLYPNPTNKELYFSRSLQNIEVFNVLGQRIIYKPEQANSISIQNLSNGIYFLKSLNGFLKFIVKH